MATKLTLEQIDAQIAKLQEQREQLANNVKEQREREALAKIADLKSKIDAMFAQIEQIAKEAEIDYVSFEGPAYGMGGYWTESSGWESSSSSC